jgi:hypothetical protein
MNHNNWPVWATEAIIIEPYNPKWPSDATKLIKELKGLHNFGSTILAALLYQVCLPNLLST